MTVRRTIRNLALTVGTVVLTIASVAGLAVGLRWLQVTTFPPTPALEHETEKEEYLAGMSQLDSSVAPNFVVIFFDDLGYGDLSSYGNRLIRTPHIDRLANQGVRMTNFYAASSVCTPSRAALLTGRYPVRSMTDTHVFFPDDMPLGVARRMFGSANELPRDEITVAEALRARGYATGMVGKWHLGGLSGHRPNDFGFDSFFGVLWSNDMTPLHLYRNDQIEVKDEREVDEWMGTYRDEDSTVLSGTGVDQARLTRMYTEESIRFIEQHKDGPFFLYLAHTFPHVPHFADPEHSGESEGGLYGDVVEDLDRGTGAIVEAIDRLDLSDRTLVLVTSDNGADYSGNPGHLRGRKGATYEGGHRVPMIARWPGKIPPGQTNDAIAMNIDFLPTLLGLAGIPLPPDRIIDGRDLAAVWMEGAASPHEHLFYFPAYGSAPDAVRNLRFKYRAATGDTGRSKAALTDPKNDTENHNLILRYPTQATELAAVLDEMATHVENNPRGWRQATP